MGLHPDALHLRQRIQRVPEMVEQLLALQQLLRGRFMLTGGMLDPIVAVEGILRFVTPYLPLIGCLIKLVRLQRGG